MYTAQLDATKIGSWKAYMSYSPILYNILVVNYNVPGAPEIF